ncbi:hypothetical protein J3R74_001415 [Puniceicoccus vermicola]
MGIYRFYSALFCAHVNKWKATGDFDLNPIFGWNGVGYWGFFLLVLLGTALSFCYSKWRKRRKQDSLNQSA